MKSLTELAKDVYNARSLPGVLAELHIQLAAQYSTMNEEMMETQLRKSEYWLVKDWKPSEERTGRIEREKPLSDKQVEMMWLQTEEGRKEVKLKYVLRSLEKLMSAVKSSLVNATIESRNL